MRGHSNAHRQTLQLLPGILAAVIPVAGCAPRVSIDDVPAGGVKVVLDANTRVVRPGSRLKFWVDVINGTENRVALDKLSVELIVSPVDKPGTVALRKSWSYAVQENIVILPGRKLTFPVVPGTRRSSHGRTEMSEFPLDKLAPGAYEIRAIVMERLISAAYRLKVDRPELRRALTPLR
ncbi:MAG: hypothetical protein O7J95_18615 [Planctomycetota bacterium]|nr:hypothetical protein [Planctomycetota bacterium]